MKKLFLLSTILFLGLKGFAQEFRANVTIQTPLLQNVDPKVFQTLEGQITEFYNNTKFTDEDEYEEHERIQIEINMTITVEAGPTQFGADFAIQATRPVYGSNYKTPIITHIDKDFVFNYEQFAPIDFAANVFSTNLSSVLSYYAYMVLGMDADSFAPYGGEPHYQQALQVVNNIPQSLNDGLKKGWRPTDGRRNRYWLLDNILTPRARDFRQAWYDYHRQGLDIMATNVEAGRAIIIETIKTVGSVNRNLPNSMILQVFSNTKATELVEIFKQGVSAEQNLLIQTMTKVDPANAAKYRKVK
jgi:hypothetical protein